jgi:hypothetical protein
MKDLPPRAYGYKNDSTSFSVFKTIIAYDFATTCRKHTLTNDPVSMTPGAIFDRAISPIDDSTLAQSLVTITVPNKVHPAYDYFELEMNISLENTYSAYLKTIKVTLYLPACALQSGIIIPLQNVPTPGQ